MFLSDHIFIFIITLLIVGFILVKLKKRPYWRYFSITLLIISVISSLLTFSCHFLLGSAPSDAVTACIIPGFIFLPYIFLFPALYGFPFFLIGSILNTFIGGISGFILDKLMKNE